MKFLRCKHCGNIVAVVEESGVKIVCCGDEMEEVVPNDTDGAIEKHVPVYDEKGLVNRRVIVTVGSEDHPMQSDHYIQWIALQTTSGNQRKCLGPDDKPEACFALCNEDEIIAAYAYCNLHGLWVSDGKEVHPKE